MKDFKKKVNNLVIAYCAFNAVVSVIYFRDASNDEDSAVVEALRVLRPLNAFQVFADMAGYRENAPPTQFTRYFPVLFSGIALYLIYRPKRRLKKAQQKEQRLQKAAEDMKRITEAKRLREEERIRRQQVKKGKFDQARTIQRSTVNDMSRENLVNAQSNASITEGMASESVEWFFGEYLVAHERSNFDLGDMNLPYNNGSKPITHGRQLLIESSQTLRRSNAMTTKDMVASAAELFKDAYVAVDQSEFQGDLLASRAHARMWLGIANSILGEDATVLEAPQKTGAGLYFAEATSKFMALQDFRLVGRVTQEWAESLLYAGLPKDANTLFMISMLMFNSFSEKGRAQIAMQRSTNTKPSMVDSSFLAGEYIPGSESMTTILGCRNTSQLRNTCISAK
jgi:hypothetical protein